MNAGSKFGFVFFFRQKKTALCECGSTNQVVEGNKIPGNMSERRDNVPIIYSIKYLANGHLTTALAQKVWLL